MYIWHHHMPWFCPVWSFTTTTSEIQCTTQKWWEVCPTKIVMPIVCMMLISSYVWHSHNTLLFIIFVAFVKSTTLTIFVMLNVLYDWLYCRLIIHGIETIIVDENGKNLYYMRKSINLWEKRRWTKIPTDISNTRSNPFLRLNILDLFKGISKLFASKSGD